MLNHKQTTHKLVIMKRYLLLLISFSIISCVFATTSIPANISHDNIVFKKIVDLNSGELQTGESAKIVSPKYPGGEKNFFKNLYAQLGYESQAKEGQKMTIVKFLVTPQGQICDVTIEFSANEDYDKKIKSVLNSLPHFYPANSGQNQYYAWIKIYCPLSK